MAKRTIHLDKILIFILLVIVSFALTSCASEIPEGNIKDFVMEIDYDKSYEYIKTGKSVITSTYYENKVEDGKVVLTTYIDKDSMYYYTLKEVSGSYFGNDKDDYNFYQQEILSYFDEENKVVVYQKTDGILDNVSYSEEDITDSVKSFFYSDVTSNYHSGGVYYGDYVLANVGNYYQFFSLNDDETELTYSVNTKSETEDGKELINMHSFTVDRYGMIISLTSRAFTRDYSMEILTTIECEYNIPINKLINL